MTEKQINFLINSINDSQGIIKAVDTKIGVLIAILSFPLTNIGKIYTCISSLLINSDGLRHYSYIFVSITFFCFWFIAFYVAIKGIIAIGNPSKNILVLESKPNGSFYSGDLFKYKVRDIFYNCDTTKSNRTLTEQIKSIPSTDESLIRELIFEQMKVVFIRDKKILRLNKAFNFALMWLAEGFILYIIFKLS